MIINKLFKRKNVKEIKEVKCLNCSKGNIIIKLGRYGLFAACNNFPACKNTIKLNEFLYDVLKKDGINIYGWDHKCWKCNKTTKVYTYFINKQLPPYMDEYVEFQSLGLDSIKPLDDYLIRNYKTINKNYSKTKGCYCTSNNCEHCNALIGNYFIVDDPHDIFDDWIIGNLDKYIVSNIDIELLGIKKENFKDLEDYYMQIC